jgi:hypothetical protein
MGCWRGVDFEDAAGDSAIRKHIVAVVIPFARGGNAPRAL